MTEGDDRSAELRETFQTELLRTPLRIDDQGLPTILHPLFGRVWAPQTFQELSALLASYGWLLGGGWRGQADIDWYLDSTAVRRIREPRPEDDFVGAPPDYLEHRVRLYEDDLLNRARLAGHGRAVGRDLHDLELLALLRHYGAATRIVDFTRNVWVALWFACREHVDRFGLVIGLDLQNAFEILDEKTLSKPYKELLDTAGTRLSVWAPSALSPRMPAQQGFFLWGVARFWSWGSIGEENPQQRLFKVDPQTSGGVPWLRSIAVAPELKHELNLRWHSLFGYDQQALFPDVGGFAQANAATEELNESASPTGEAEEGDIWDETDEDDDEEADGGDG